MANWQTSEYQNPPNPQQRWARPQKGQGYIQSRGWGQTNYQAQPQNTRFYSGEDVSNNVNSVINEINKTNKTTPDNSQSSTPQSPSDVDMYNGHVGGIGINENEKKYWMPSQFWGADNVFNFDQYNQWRNQYGGMAQGAQQRAQDAYLNQSQGGDLQRGLASGAYNKWTEYADPTSQALYNMQGTQNYIGRLGRGEINTAGGQSQSSALGAVGNSGRNNLLSNAGYGSIGNLSTNQNMVNRFAAGQQMTGNQFNQRGALDQLGDINRANRFGSANQDAMMRLAGSQQLMDQYASGGKSTASQDYQNQLLGTLNDAALGKGPSAAQSQFQQNLDQSMAAVKAQMAGQRGMTPGMAARLGANTQSQMGLQAAQQSAQLRAQEQQQAQQLASQAFQGARGQDYQDRAAAAQLNADVQKAMSGQEQTGLNSWAQYAGQGREQDYQDRALAANYGLQQQQQLSGTDQANLNAWLSGSGTARGQDLQAAGLMSQTDLAAQSQLGKQELDQLVASGNLANQARSADMGMYGTETNLWNQYLGNQQNLDQQQLQLRQAKEQYDYNRWRDWQNWMVTQYGGAGNYQTPWSQQAAAGAGAGAAQGAAEALLTWGLNKAGG